MALSPLLVSLSLISAMVMRGNPFFVQPRPGRSEKIFMLIKFRTMSNAKDKDGNLLPDDIRLNSYGKFLRSTSLDELPELLNVLLGEMSFVGPRPLLIRYLPYYTEREQLRHTVRPGITGWAQINGRNAATWDNRLLRDVEYVENMTFYKDIKILLNTILKVLGRKDVAVCCNDTLEDLDIYRKNKII